MSSAPVQTLREIPPFQDALAMTGELAIRGVCKDFKTLFDTGICRVWTILKAEANNDLRRVAVYMNNIEKLNGGEPKSENFLIFFKHLNNQLIKGLVVSGSSSRLPTTIASFQFCGPKYVKNAIPEDIQKKAARIEQLKHAVVERLVANSHMDAPAKLLCPVTMEIMTIPIIDFSHPHVQKIWNDVKSCPEQSSVSVNYNYETSSRHCHVVDATVDSFQNCPECRHPTQRDHFLISGILQNEILHFLEDRSKEVCIDCDVGLGNALGFRSADDWERTVTFTWTPKGWTGFLPIGTEFKFVKSLGGSNVVWEQREGNRTIPTGLKDQFYKIEDVPSFQ